MAIIMGGASRGVSRREIDSDSTDNQESARRVGKVSNDLIFSTRTLDYLTNEGLVGKVILKPVLSTESLSGFPRGISNRFKYAVNELKFPESASKFVVVTDYALVTYSNGHSTFCQETGTAIFLKDDRDDLERMLGDEK